jgi:hypothetical protein
MDEANGAVVKFEADKSEEDLWGAIAGAWSRWWSVFLRQYGNRCFQRWRDQCGNQEDYEGMERLWAECFVPLQTAGCDAAKQVRLKSVKEDVVHIAQHPEVSDTESEALLQWVKPLDSTLSKLISSHTELQKQIIARSLKDLAEQEKPSPLDKLRRSIFGKGQ